MIRSFKGKTPQIHPSAYVSEVAYVIGDVEIGEGSSIWPGSVVRADLGKITIGKYTCVQDNSVVHGDADVEIGDYVVIAHRVVCHGRVIGDRTLIGNGATVNDGVELGEDCLVASGAVIPDEQKFPAESLIVGIPGKSRGKVTARFKERIKGYGEWYAELTRRYKDEGGLE